MAIDPVLARHLSRRGFMKSCAAMALLGPVVRTLSASAATAKAPRRLVLIFSPDGPMKAAGPASGTETAFTVHDWWKPLDRHRADGIFLSHLASTGAAVVNGGGHALGGQVFSGFGGGYGGDDYAQRGETIDQIIGKRLEAEKRGGVVRSVVWGNLSASRTGGTGEAFATGPGRNIVPEMDPSKAWAQLFSNFMPAPSPTEVARLARKKSILDFLAKDCTGLRDALGAEGTRLLDDHCTTVRSIENGLATTLPNSCTKPTDPGTKDWTNPENSDVQTAAFIDLIAASFACELTSVVGYQFGPQAARNRIASSYGVPSSSTVDSGDSGPAHHPWTHQPDSDARMTALSTFTRFYASQVALLVDKLKSTKDATGAPLLDSTMVLWVSELGGREDNVYDAHITGALPAVLFGSGQGTFKTGRYLRGGSPDDKLGGAQMAQILVALMQYMGLTDVTTVGATGVKGPLTSLYG